MAPPNPRGTSSLRRGVSQQSPRNHTSMVSPCTMLWAERSSSFCSIVPRMERPMFTIGMPILPILLVRTIFNGIVMHILTRHSLPDVPDEVRDLHPQVEGGSGGDEAYE